MTKELTPGEKLEQAISVFFPKDYWNDPRNDEVKKLKKEYRQALADFIEGEMEKVIGTNYPTKKSYLPEIKASIKFVNREKDYERQRLKKFLEELRS